MAELCIEGEGQTFAEAFAAAGDNKSRRTTLNKNRTVKTPKDDGCEGPHKDPRGRRLKEVFVKVDRRAPRVGTVVLDRGEELFRDFQSLCSNMAVQSVEVCRGTDRFRLPKGNPDLELIPLRQTFVLHRETGEVYELGNPEEWTKLPKTRRYQKSKPAKVCVTVFGGFPERASSSNTISQYPCIRYGGHCTHRRIHLWKQSRHKEGVRNNR